MPILEDPMINRDECDFSKFEEWFKTVETHQSSEWFDTDLQPELTDSDTSSYFYPNSSDNVFSDNSPLDSSTSSSELGSIEQNNFFFNEDFPSKNLQFTSSYPFDSFGFSKSVEEIRIEQLLLKNNEQSRQKPIKTKPVKAGKNQLGGCYLNGRPLAHNKEASNY
ncbi:hypothetical protein M3Y97_00569600 [Aphelenchoides bicaudatus]|nr:hypothetical protein M3Y97_00569600 [Aphelenchoides bicaudatus]